MSPLASPRCVAYVLFQELGVRVRVRVSLRLFYPASPRCVAYVLFQELGVRVRVRVSLRLFYPASPRCVAYVLFQELGVRVRVRVSLRLFYPASPRCVAYVLFQELGFRGAVNDEYYDPRNSFIDQVGIIWRILCDGRRCHCSSQLRLTISLRLFTPLIRCS